jgi:hypothetical protein
MQPRKHETTKKKGWLRLVRAMSTESGKKIVRDDRIEAPAV